MFVLRAGCKAPFPGQLHEAYAVTDNRLTANVSADKIKSVMEHFIRLHNEPLFFILELPAKQDDETEISPGVLEKLHVDVYYIDGCTQEEALAILLRVGDLMINDGLCSFGFGCHDSTDEIMFGKYNVTTVFSRQIEKYHAFFQEHGIFETDRLITAWDTFNGEHPGASAIVKTNGKDVYAIPEMFAAWGIYKAEQREG